MSGDRRRTEALAAIATTTLGLPTLETRKSDALDFHDLAVWSVKAALEQAYEAGQKAGDDGAFRRAYEGAESQ